LGPAGDHVAQPITVKRDYLGRLHRHAGADRWLPCKRGDIADVRAAVRVRDVHVLAGLSIDELDQTTDDHIERRIALGMLVEHLPRLEAESLTALGQPLE